MAEQAVPPIDVRRLLPLMLTLSLTTGLIDAVSVLGLGKVFTANMTGNVVFLGMAAAGASGFVPSLYIVAIASFMGGAVTAGRIGRHEVQLSLRRWLVTSASVEAILLWAAAWTAADYDVAGGAIGATLYAVIVLTGIAMGFRNATVRQLKIPDVTTTVLTLTITGLAADSTLGGGTNPNWGRRIASVGTMFAGAAIGAWLVLGEGLSVALLVAGAIGLSATLLCASRRP
jgi:uncharacterized membrane protein YoaK (UPF0700 family)